MNQTDEVELFWQRRLPVVTLSCCESLVKTVGKRQLASMIARVQCRRQTVLLQWPIFYLALLTLVVNQSPFTVREVHVRQ
ncbi:hypothetical protein T07_9905 [Trichinella nelsoni]|uniref:Uncharacterized protein n=1 Tax=Trichinella nelsoni TaxID=6336 RepID=A0A0V0S8F4_9BILA|nr:hypothetical protein T07_9905 [Trichinella nelsoni]